MSLFNVFDVAGSAMSAQSVRLNTTASNLANADAVSSSLEETYKARKPIFAAEMQKAAGQFAAGTPGSEDSVPVKVLAVVESDAPLRQEYMPGHPMADENGMVYKPNVNVMEEMADMISASRSYQTNVQVADAAKQMLQRTLTLGQA